jgi:hypothetical protein
MVTVEHNPNPLLRKAHLICLNLSSFKMIEAMGLKVIASGFPFSGITSVSNFMKIYQAVQSYYLGQTDRHTDSQREW